MKERPEVYAAALSQCETLEQLRACVLSEALALDAREVVRDMTPADFKVWRVGLAKERRGGFAGEDFARRFGAVLMPDPMFTIAMIAEQYKVPFSVAEMRLRDVRPELFERDTETRHPGAR